MDILDFNLSLNVLVNCKTAIPPIFLTGRNKLGRDREWFQYFLSYMIDDATLFHSSYFMHDCVRLEMTIINRMNV